MWIPNIPVAFLQIILFVVAVIAALKDREYVKRYYKVTTEKRLNYWLILLAVCALGEVFGFIAQAFSFFVEYAP